MTHELKTDEVTKWLYQILWYLGMRERISDHNLKSDMVEEKWVAGNK